MKIGNLSCVHRTDQSEAFMVTITRVFVRMREGVTYMWGLKTVIEEHATAGTPITHQRSAPIATDTRDTHRRVTHDALFATLYDVYG